MRPLDRVDANILEALRANARTPLAALGRRLGLSRNALRQRIERLERDHVIGGYTIVAGRRQDAAVASALIMIYRKDRLRGADVLTFLKKLPEVRACYVLSGEADLLVELAAPSQERIQEIWAELARLPGVVDTRTSFVLSTVVRRP